MSGAGGDFRDRAKALRGLPLTVPTGFDDLGLDEADLRGARRLNRLLSVLPRFHTGRRWNVRAVGALLAARRALVPDVRRLASRVTTIPIPGCGISIRLTRPVAKARGIILHFHGGAWVMGDARLEDGLAAAMASQCGAGVAAVDFRNAGDDDLAATLNGCLAAGEWLIDNLGRFEVSRVILSGESSGAHLALETLLGLRSAGKAGCVIGFYSMCGAFNLDGSPGLKESTPSTLLIDGPSALVNLKRLTPSLEPGQRRGPLWADLSRLPPALLIAGSLDPICDDTRELGERWHQASGNASCIFVPEAPHGFNRMPTRLASRINAMGRAWIRERFDDGACTGDAAGYGAGDPLQRFSSHLPE